MLEFIVLFVLDFRISFDQVYLIELMFDFLKEHNLFYPLFLMVI
jgi:hypothetical protein